MTARRKGSDGLTGNELVGPMTVATRNHRPILLTVILSVSLCGCTFQSNQYSFVKNFIAGEKRTLDVFWWEGTLLNTSSPLIPMIYSGNLVLTDGKERFALIQNGHLKEIRNIQSGEHYKFTIPMDIEYHAESGSGGVFEHTDSGNIVWEKAKIAPAKALVSLSLRSNETEAEFSCTSSVKAVGGAIFLLRCIDSNGVSLELERNFESKGLLAGLSLRLGNRILADIRKTDNLMPEKLRTEDLVVSSGGPN